MVTISTENVKSEFGRLSNLAPLPAWVGDVDYGSTLKPALIRDYFSLLGYATNEPVYLRALPGKGYSGGGGRKFEATLLDSLNWTELEALQDADVPMAIYAVVNGQGHVDKDVLKGRAVFFEWDDISKGEQLKRVKELGLLPFISFAVETRKSIHFYVVLDTLCGIEEWRQLQADLLAFTSSDKTLKNPSRVLRPAGALHLQKDTEPFLCNFVLRTGVRSSYEAIRSFVPVAKKVRTTKSSTSRKSSPSISLEKLVEKVSRPAMAEEAQQRDLDNAYHELSGTAEGGRNAALFKVGCKLGRRLFDGLDVTKAFTTLCTAASVTGLQSEEYVSTALRALDTGFTSAIEESPAYMEEQYSIRKPDLVIHQRYIGELPFNSKKHLVLKSQKGTGKTYALQSYINSKLSNGQRVILVGHRVVLLQQQANSLGLACYKNLADFNVDALAVSLDSLHRVNASNFKNAVVIIDEASQVLKHLSADTDIRHNRRLVVESLLWLIKNAAQVVFLDADMSQVEVEALAKLVGRKNINVAINEQPATLRNFVRHNSKSSLLTYLYAAVAQGKNVYVPTNVKADALALEAALKEKFPNAITRVISSDNSQTAESQEFICNINMAVKDVQVLFGSPSLGTGVDINLEHFDVTCAFIGSGTQQAASDVLQHVARVRQLRSNEVHLFVKDGWNEVELDAEVIRQNLTSAKEPSLYCIDSKTGEKKPVGKEAHDWYLELYSETTARHNLSVMNLSNSLVRLIEAEGHTIQQYEEVSTREELNEAKATLERKAEELDNAKVEAILNAEALDDKAVEQLKDAALTPEQKDAKAQFYLRRDTGLDKPELTADLVKWYMGGGREGIRTHIDTFVKADALSLEKDYRETNIEGVYLTDLSHAATKAKLLRKLIPSDILSGATYTHDSLVESGWLTLALDCTTELKNLFGIKVSEKKPVQTMSKLLELVGLEVTGTRIRTCSTSSPSYKKEEKHLEQKLVRVYAATPESIARLSGILDRTLPALRWKWYMSTERRIAELTRSGDKLRADALRPVLTELAPHVAERLAERERLMSHF